MAELRRNLGFGLLTFYGVGVMVGAGIYVLTGTIAATAGHFAPLAFLLAGLVAAPTALSYGELSARIPESAGEAAYVRAAFRSENLALLTGLLIIGAGTISASAVLQGGVGYLLSVWSVPDTWAIISLGVLLTLIAISGVVASLGFAAILTLIEVSGLLVVIWVGTSGDPIPLPEFQGLPYQAIAFGAVLAFFAFIGFEDMVNLSEETINPGRTMPYAIITALVVTTILYALVVWASVRVVEPDMLGQSRQPLALVYQTATGNDPWSLSVIAVFAAINGVLAQIIMAARVLFGLGRRIPWLKPFSVVSKTSGTPITATALIGAIIVLAALFLDLETLAETTSILLLFVFCAMNAALLVLKSRGKAHPDFQVPALVPILGLVFSSIALGAALFGS